MIPGEGGYHFSPLCNLTPVREFALTGMRIWPRKRDHPLELMSREATILQNRLTKIVSRDGAYKNGRNLSFCIRDTLSGHDSDHHTLDVDDRTATPSTVG